MTHDQLLKELRDIDGELRCAAKHIAHGRMHNCRTIKPGAPTEQNAEITAALIEANQDRQETNALVARKNEILQQLAQPGRMT